MVKTLCFVLGGLAMVSLGVWIAVGVVSVAGIETPAYELIEARDGYEIRAYAPHIVAEVTVEGDFGAGMNGGFRTLADYIFGNNTPADSDGAAAEIAMTAPVIERSQASAEIAMTAPVQERAGGDGRRVIAFVMPSEYTLETLPRPNNPAVRLVEVPAKRYAVLTFSGRVPEDTMRDRKNKLRALLERDQLETVGEPLLCQYDPPWTPPWMRTNEVWIELA